MLVAGLGTSKCGRSEGIFREVVGYNVGEGQEQTMEKFEYQP